MRLPAVDISLGAGGVTSGTAGWCSGRCSEYGGSRGDGVLETEGVTSGTVKWCSGK